MHAARVAIWGALTPVHLLAAIPWGWLLLSLDMKGLLCGIKGLGTEPRLTNQYATLSLF